MYFKIIFYQENLEFAIMTKICMAITLHLKMLNGHALMTLTALQFKMRVAMALEFFISVGVELRVQARRVFM